MPKSITSAYQVQNFSGNNSIIIIPATGGQVAPICMADELCMELIPTPTAMMPVVPDSCSLDYDFTFEQRVVELVNEERAKYDLPALEWNQTLGDVARDHSADMLCNRYASHNDLDNTGPEIRMAARGYEWVYYGENIAAGPSFATPEKVVKAWMGSSHHRDNILNPDFVEIGVGFVFSISSTYDNYWTMDFGQSK